MTRYDDVELPDGSRHPLAGVPQDVLDAAREALRGAVIYPLVAPPPGVIPGALERDYDADPTLDGDLESIADGIVAAIRATGWTARSSGLADLSLTSNLVLARRALERLASPELLTEAQDGETFGSIRATELNARREYARRAWLGDRVDLKIETKRVPSQETVSLMDDNPATTGE
jgi:hypothetical protein